MTTWLDFLNQLNQPIEKNVASAPAAPTMPRAANVTPQQAQANTAFQQSLQQARGGQGVGMWSSMAGGTSPPTIPPQQPVQGMPIGPSMPFGGAVSPTQAQLNRGYQQGMAAGYKSPGGVTNRPTGGSSTAGLTPGTTGVLSKSKVAVTVDDQGRVVDSKGNVYDPDTEQVIVPAPPASPSDKYTDPTTGIIYVANPLTYNGLPTGKYEWITYIPAVGKFMSIEEANAYLSSGESPNKQSKEIPIVSERIVTKTGPDEKTYTLMERTDTAGNVTYGSLPEEGITTGTTKVNKDGQIIEVPWTMDVKGKKTWADGVDYRASPTPGTEQTWTSGKYQGKNVFGLAGATKEGGAMDWVDPRNLEYIKPANWQDSYDPYGFLNVWDPTTGEAKQDKTKYDPAHDVVLQQKLADAKTEAERQVARDEVDRKYREAQLELERQTLAQRQAEWASEHPSVDMSALGGAGTLSRQAFDALPPQQKQAWMNAWDNGSLPAPWWYKASKSTGGAGVGTDASWVAARQY